MTDIDNLVTEALVAASVAERTGHLETRDAFREMARQFQMAGKAAKGSQITATSTPQNFNL